MSEEDFIDNMLKEIHEKCVKDKKEGKELMKKLVGGTLK